MHSYNSPHSPRIAFFQVIEKKVTKLEAEIVGVPKPDVLWYKNGALIDKEDDRVQIHDAKGGVFQLIIKNSQSDDTGEYKCRAVNSVGASECTALLEIEMKPEFVRKLETLHAVESCEAEWAFSVKGLPKPDISFARNNIPGKNKRLFKRNLARTYLVTFKCE
jgi:hypothetical protein